MNNNPQKYVCSDCAGSNELKIDIFAEEKERKTCSYCKNRRLCISVDSLANAVDNVYRNDYELCDSGHSPSEIISGEILELGHSAGVLDIDLVNILSNRELGSEYKDSEPMFDENMTYCSLNDKYPPINDGREHKELWEFFCDKIKHRTRFFNNQVIGWLNEIFLGLDKISYKDGISPIRKIHPTDLDAVFYRARKTASAQERIKICCAPSQELSSPPVHRASSGRMNPMGITVFYAAFERETCIAEIRLAVGETAISGQFKLENPITIFDLTVFDKIDSEKTISDDSLATLDYETANSFEDRIAFLHKFSAEISKPIPPDKEALDYMPTQALVEYLAHHYEPQIDAVVYASTQTNGKGKNIVLSNHASKVINNQNQEAGNYNAKWGDDFYHISLCKRPPCGKTRQFYFDSVEWDEHANITFDENYEFNQEEYLSFVEDSLELHKVLAVDYDIKSLNITIE